MVEPITEKKIAELREAFEIFDRDQDGYITIKELAEIMRNLGNPPTEGEIQDMIAEVDIDGNGNINFQEYISLMARRMRDGDLEEEMKQVFKLFDRDGNGLVGASELKSVMIGIGEKITDDEVEDMIREADKDGDGYISYQEFKDIIENRDYY
jgi:calmodulin